MSTVHIFVNANGVFIKKTLEYVEELEPGNHYYFVERGSEKEIPKEQLLQSRSHIESLIQSGKITHLLFHSLHYYQFRWLRHIQKSYPFVKTSWMFWSFEYYQLSFEVTKLYAPFSKQFLTRKLFFNLWENTVHFIKGNALTLLPISRRKYQSVMNQLDQFCSFNSVDYERIFSQKSQVKYHFMPYLDETDLFVQKELNVLKNRIMVGHNGSPLLNHVEVLNHLHQQNCQEEIILPLNYGKAAYISSLKKELSRFRELNVHTLDHQLSIKDYYAFVSDVEYFLLNSYCQQGLGNIIYFLFNDSTVYLSEKSSSYHFFQRLGFTVKSMENLLSGEALSPISVEEKQKNRSLVKAHFNREKVLSQWKSMGSF